MPTDNPSVRIPRPALVGVASGIVVSLAIILLDLLPDSQGHAILVAAIATPYLVFALLDGSPQSLIIEISVMVAFVTIAFVLFDSPAWMVAFALAAHGMWDLVHINDRITANVGDYPIWCGTLDVTAAAVLLLANALG